MKKKRNSALKKELSINTMSIIFFPLYIAIDNGYVNGLKNMEYLTSEKFAFDMYLMWPAAAIHTQPCNLSLNRVYCVHTESKTSCG